MLFLSGFFGVKGISMAEILELVVNQSYRNQLVVNRFHYVMSGTPAAVTPSFALVAATGYEHVAGTPLVFDGGTVASGHQAIPHTSLQFVSAYARNLYSVTDFYERPYPTGVYGVNTGESMSPICSLGFFSSRVRTDIRRGMKRFAGVTESCFEAGGLLTSGWLSTANSIAELLSDTLTYDDEGNTLTFVPTILGLEEYTTSSGKAAYRPYATKAAQEAHLAQGVVWSPYAEMRTQNSRQYKRGA